MITPYSHTHVSHLSRLERRRSKSVTLPDSNQTDAVGHSFRRKKFLAQLKKERRKQQNNGASEGEEPEENQNEQEQDEDGHHEPVVTRIARTDTVTSSKKQRSYTAVTRYSAKNIATTDTSATQAAEQHSEYQASVTRIPRAATAVSLKNQLSNASGKDSNNGSSTIGTGLYFDFPNTSSSNLISKSEIYDQRGTHKYDTAHARKNDVKSHGSIRISEREGPNNGHSRKLSSNASASFMAAIIAIIIGVIAFAFALAALILVLLLRVTVSNSLGINSTSSSGSSSSSGSGSGSLPSSCSAYTTLDDPTRNVNAAGYALGCDNTAPFINRTYPVWIRFIGAGGATLPLTTPGMNICGTEGTGWYDGTMPSSTGSIANGTACFSWYTSVCRYSVSISVANCGSFYIYYLPPAPACMMRYCTI